MDLARRRGIARTKAVVVVSLVGASTFGLFLGYLAWANDSFPIRQAPFSEYAAVSSSVFNGSEYAFTLTWKSGDFKPLYAQLTSPASNAANTPVCELGLASVGAGQAIFMPFAIKPLSATLSNVDLSVAVRTTANGTEFTIVYHVDSVIAQPTTIHPSTYSCSQPNSPM